MKKEKLYKKLCDFSLWRPPTMATLVKQIGYSGNKGLIASFKSLEKDGRVYKKGRHYYPIFNNYIDKFSTDGTCIDLRKFNNLIRKFNNLNK